MGDTRGLGTDHERRTGQRSGDIVALWRTVGAGYASVQRGLMAEVEAQGLQSQSFEVLMRLDEATDRRMPMSKLAVEVGMTSGGLTKLVDRLETAGLTERQHDSTDRRVVYTALTDEGRRLARQLVAGHDAALRAVVLETLTVDEVDQMASMMQRILDDQPE